MTSVRRLLLGSLLGVAVAACSIGASAPTAAPSVTPAPSDAAPPTAVPGATGTPEPTATESSLPTAFMVLPDGSRVVGALGSYTFDNGGSDSPWFPFDALKLVRLGSNERVEVAFGDGAGVLSWIAEVAVAADTEGHDVRPFASGGADASVVMGPMPDGHYVLAVNLSRADGRGSGLYSWAVSAGQ